MISEANIISKKDEVRSRKLDEEGLAKENFNNSAKFNDREIKV